MIYCVLIFWRKLYLKCDCLIERRIKKDKGWFAPILSLDQNAINEDTELYLKIWFLLEMLVIVSLATTL